MSQQCSKCHCQIGENVPKDASSLQFRRKHLTELCLCTLEEIPDEAKSSASETANLKSAKGDLAAFCCICMNVPSDSVLIPCEHRRTCYACAEMIMTTCDGRCPVCRQKMTSIQKASN